MKVVLLLLAERDDVVPSCASGHAYLTALQLITHIFGAHYPAPPPQVLTDRVGLDTEPRDCADRNICNEGKHLYCEHLFRPEITRMRFGPCHCGKQNQPELLSDQRQDDNTGLRRQRWRPAPEAT